MNFTISVETAFVLPRTCDASHTKRIRDASDYYTVIPELDGTSTDVSVVWPKCSLTGLWNLNQTRRHLCTAQATAWVRYRHHGSDTIYKLRCLSVTRLPSEQNACNRGTHTIIVYQSQAKRKEEKIITVSARHDDDDNEKHLTMRSASTWSRREYKFMLRVYPIPQLRPGWHVYFGGVGRVIGWPIHIGFKAPSQSTNNGVIVR